MMPLTIIGFYSAYIPSTWWLPITLTLHLISTCGTVYWESLTNSHSQDFDEINFDEMLEGRLY